jgi:hypothetical protein
MEEIIEDMGCARQKAAKLLDELDNIVGLIERKRQGLHMSNTHIRITLLTNRITQLKYCVHASCCTKTNTPSFLRMNW